MTPSQLHCYYTFEFRNVGSLKHIVSMSASISGMAEGVWLSTGELSTNTCTIPLEAYPGKDGNSIVGGFYTFGHHEDVSNPHRMALYIIMEDGKQFKYTEGENLDVTEQIHKAPDRHRVHLIIDGLSMPKIIENGSGFDVSVGDWSDINKDIEI